MLLVLTAGQRGDSPQFGPVLERIRVPRLGPGRPWSTLARALADKAYASWANRGSWPRSRLIRPPTGANAAHAAGVSTRSIPRSTSSGTRWSAGSTGSSASVRCPHASTKLAIRYKATVQIAAINDWL